MRKPDNRSALARFFQNSSVVVEVLNGESQDDAWRRFLADNPDGAGARIKIFHYPEPVSRKKINPDILQLPRGENRI